MEKGRMDAESDSSIGGIPLNDEDRKVLMLLTQELSQLKGVLQEYMKASEFRMGQIERGCELRHRNRLDSLGQVMNLAMLASVILIAIFK